MTVLPLAAILLAFFRNSSLGSDGENNEQSQDQSGYELFLEKNCIQCHNRNNRETKIGPGLQGLFKRENLPASGKKVTEENVRNQLKTPYKMMPSFADLLTETERTELIEYLKTL